MPSSSLPILIVIGSCLSQAAGNPVTTKLAPLYVPKVVGGDLIPNKYIIMFKHKSSDYVIDQHWRSIGMNLSSEKGFHHFSVLSGYIADLNDTTLAVVRRDVDVSFVEADFKAQANLGWIDGPHHLNRSRKNLFPRMPPSSTHSGDLDSESPPFPIYTQPDASWNLAVDAAPKRLNFESTTPDGVIEVPDGLEYKYWTLSGRNVKIYILDTGVEIGLDIFGGRASNFRNYKRSPYAPANKKGDPPKENNVKDQMGHGTPVAALAGAREYGIARNAELVSVKVINDDDEYEMSLVAAAVDGVLDQHAIDEFVMSDSDYRGAVINLSMHLDTSNAKNAQTLLTSIQAAVAHGIAITASAGNSRYDHDKDNWVPCYFDGVICVGAIGVDYRMWKESSVGSHVKFLAPGLHVVTVDPDGSQQLDSGSSLAAPVVAGIAAQMKSWKGRGLGSFGLEYDLIANSLHGICDGVPEKQPNRLINTGIQLEGKAADEPYIGAGPYAFPDDTLPSGGEPDEGEGSGDQPMVICPPHQGGEDDGDDSSSGLSSPPDSPIPPDEEDDPMEIDPDEQGDGGDDSDSELSSPPESPLRIREL